MTTKPSQSLCQALWKIYRRPGRPPSWAGLPLYDAEEWLVYLAER